MHTFLIVAGLVILLGGLLLLPLWSGRRRRGLMTSMLTRYQTITGALLDGDLGSAGEELKAIIRLDTEDVGAYLKLARLLRRMGERERAIAVTRSLLARRLPRPTLRREILAGLITDLLALRRVAEARPLAEELRRLDRRSPLLARVELEEALGREAWEEALRALAGLRRAGAVEREEEGVVRVRIATARAAAGAEREARRMLEEALRADPGLIAAGLQLGDLWLAAGEPARAAEVWSRLLRERPEAAASLVERLERAYFELGRYGELEPLYAGFLSADGGGPAALRLALARMRLRKGDPEGGLALIEEFLEREPDHRGAAAWKLYLLLEAGRVSDARQVLKQAVEAERAGAGVAPARVE